MRINDIVNLLIPPQPLSRVRSAGAATGDANGGSARQLLALTNLVTQGLTGGDTAAASDQASFSPDALSRAGSAGAGSDNPGVIETTTGGSSGDTNGPDLGGITENYIRRRAILTYSLPAVGPNGAAISLTFDIEASQRTTRFFGPSGQQLDKVA